MGAGALDGDDDPVRLLLIDNFDSFTFNLCHLLGRLNGGVAPVVVTSDKSWEHVSALIAEHAIEGVVISPGPGRPDCAADFGVCTEALEHCGLPILGVCLGHQGLAHCHGGRVVTATEPRHGRLSQVTILEDTESLPMAGDLPRLFRGVASPFSVVRYHSLVVERSTLPAALVPLAETEDDGAIMALRHSSLPRWGLQFHPESICTEFGAALMRNFLDIARAWNDQNPLPPSPPADDTMAASDEYTSEGAAAAFQRLRTAVAAGDTSCCASATIPAALLPSVHPAEVSGGQDKVELALLFDTCPFPAASRRCTSTSEQGNGDACDFAAAVYDLLFARTDPSFWLDSATAEAGGRGRFSFMGDGCGPRAHLVCSSYSSLYSSCIPYASRTIATAIC